MDRLQLTSVPADTSLRDALKRFRPNTRALIVRRPGGSGYLLTASDIASGINDAIDAERDPATVTVGEIQPKTPVEQVARPPALRIAPMEEPLSADEWNSVGAAFGTARARTLGAAGDHRFYTIQTIQHLGDETAVVVTSSETYAAELGQASTICECVGDPVHTFEKRQLTDPTKCNKAHGVAVTCSQAS